MCPAMNAISGAIHFKNLKSLNHFIFLRNILLNRYIIIKIAQTRRIKLIRCQKMAFNKIECGFLYDLFLEPYNSIILRDFVIIKYTYEHVQFHLQKEDGAKTDR